MYKRQGEKPLFLSKEDNTIYQMIAGRMVEAFSEKCVKVVTTVTAECAGVEFTVKGSVVTVVTSLTHFSENASTMRPAII